MAQVTEAGDPATLLASLARNIPGAIYRCALDEHWTMHLLGDEIERITGYPAEDFIENRRRTYASVIHPDDQDDVARDVAEAVGEARPFELEYRVVCSSGEERWVLERGCAVDGGDTWLDGVIFDITERRRFEETARRAEAEAAAAREIAESRRRIVRAADEARARIERDLHDGAQQSLVSSMIMLRAAREQLGPDAGGADELLEEAQAHLDRGIADLRHLAQGIHPIDLTDKGVGAALRALIGHAPIPMTVVDEVDERLDPDVEAALYFAGAEAITNAVKHARASTLSVVLGRTDAHVYVEVIDDGVGGADYDGGSGLRGLCDRMATVAGTLEIHSPPGAGTRLIARIEAGAAPDGADDAIEA